MRRMEEWQIKSNEPCDHSSPSTQLSLSLSLNSPSPHTHHHRCRASTLEALTVKLSLFTVFNLSLQAHSQSHCTLWVFALLTSQLSSISNKNITTKINLQDKQEEGKEELWIRRNWSPKYLLIYLWYFLAPLSPLSLLLRPPPPWRFVAFNFVHFLFKFHCHDVEIR